MMTREGVRGMEYNAWSAGNPPEHTTILPFTRMLAGPLDYTPGIFNLKFDASGKHRVYTTLAKQLALYVVLYSPMQMAADLIENYKGQPAFQFIRDVPVNWDESKVLNAKIGDFVTIARRKGDRWYVGSITDEQPREIRIELDFLEESRTYRVKMYRDAAATNYETNPAAIKIEQFT
ncbi:MAG: glycoside hydrolase family 97 catalytic domain-containing protein, partial [Deltaproteobacteria bacterium]|nr:glycoside hydrolase family 97 catalytic domain-containing protein [Deltaproteobacteria bacterium]